MHTRFYLENEEEWNAEEKHSDKIEMHNLTANITQVPPLRNNNSSYHTHEMLRTSSKHT
jgi:hypothetical protein